MLDGVGSGSILLFHNDLENTTQALPEILSKLRSEGYELVGVSELIYHDDYTINAEGRQIPQVKASIDITPENVDEVMAQYADEIAAAGVTEQQAKIAAQAIKSGAELPEEVRAVIADLGIEITENAAVAASKGAVDTSSPDGQQTNGTGKQ